MYTVYIQCRSDVAGLHTAHCTLHTAHCTLHTAHCTLHTLGGELLNGGVEATTTLTGAALALLLRYT